MTQLAPIVAEFEGKKITTLTWSGRPAWIAREIGTAIGYANHGKRLVTQITGEWADDFIPGQDYEILKGDDLARFKVVEADGTELVASKTNRGLVLLYESGLHMALTKTNKPVGRRLRRFLVDEVLPQIVRTGRYEAPQLCLFPNVPGPVPTLAERRETRLGDREVRLAGRLDLDDRKFRVATIHRTAEILRALGRIDDDQFVLLEVSACEIALGFPLVHLYPPPVREAVASALGLEPAAVEDEPAETVAQAA